MSSQALRALESELHRWEGDRDLSGAVLLTQHDETLAEWCFGQADRSAGTPVGPATRFATASFTKMLTAVAVVDQVAQERLAFDTRVVDLLPPHLRPSTLRADVTVHHLLCHTSGIADYYEEDPPDGSDAGEYADLWAELPSYRIERPADFLPLFADLPAYWPPGERCWYSNAGYILLGILLEHLTDRPFPDIVQRSVLDRAGMADSGFWRLDEVVEDLALNYVRQDDGTWRTNHFGVPVIGGADGGAQVTARDVDRFLTAYDDGTLLGDLHDLVLHPHADYGEGYSFGYGVLRYPDGRFGHGGGDPGVDVLVHRWPDDDANLVVLCNTEGNAGDVRDRVLEAWRA